MSLLQRRATPYSVDNRARARQSSYPDSTAVLTPSSGVVTTVRDLAKFDLALKQGILLKSGTLEQAWNTPTADGSPLPHGIGWFVVTSAKIALVMIGLVLATILLGTLVMAGSLPGGGALVPAALMVAFALVLSVPWALATWAADRWIARARTEG